MQIGIPKEVKDNESRVALTPDGAAALAAAGHEVRVEHGAGIGAGFPDEAYERCGAELVAARAAWGARLVVKVKEPVPAEHAYFKGQLLLSYLHLAGSAIDLTQALLASGTTAIAYETIEDSFGRFPLLQPMSAIAGAMTPTIGNYYLQKPRGGRGTLLAEVLERRNGRVLVLGDGTVGWHAARVAAGMGASVIVLGLKPERAAEFRRAGAGIEFEHSTAEALEKHLPDTDLLIGAVLSPGARAPKLVTAEMVGRMPGGAVLIDVSIDQGGCIATSRATTHSDPVFVAHGVTHYCVTNMPGAYPRTSTLALTAATLPYVLRIADGGVDAVLADRRFAAGVQTHEGFVTYRAVAQSLGLMGRFRSLPEG
jgi:alanine dehydrogenase